MARVLQGVSGGIAAYKACELTRLLVKAGHDVAPLVTRGAEEFVTAKTFNALAGRPADEDLYPHLERADHEPPHVGTRRDAGERCDARRTRSRAYRPRGGRARRGRVRHRAHVRGA